jgi:hypothetical protein
MWSAPLLSAISGNNNGHVYPIRDLGILFVLSAAFACMWLMNGPPLECPDGLFHLLRGELLAHELLQGQFPVRWSPDLVGGYGYPLFVFYAPLAYYIVALLHLLGLSTAVASAVSWALIIVGTPTVAWGWGNALFGRSAGLFMGLAALTAPYWFDVSAHQRGALPEAFTVPLAMGVGWSLSVAARRPSFFSVVWGGLAAAALIVAHPLSALLHAMWLGAFAVALAFLSTSPRTKYLSAVAGIVLFALTTSAWYWVPLASLHADVQAERLAIMPQEFSRNAIIFLPSLLAGPFSITRNISLFDPFIVNPLGWWLGPVPVLALFATVLLPRFLWRTLAAEHKALLVLSLLGCVGMTVVATRPAVELWGVVRGARILQFPWRLLLPASCWAVLMSGMVLPAVSRLIMRSAWPDSRWSYVLLLLCAAAIAPWRQIVEVMGLAMFCITPSSSDLLTKLNSVGSNAAGLWAFIAAGAAMAYIASWLVPRLPAWKVLLSAAPVMLLAVIGLSGNMQRPFNTEKQWPEVSMKEVVALDWLWPRAKKLREFPFSAFWPQPTQWPLGVGLDFVPGFLPRWVTKVPESPGGGWAQIAKGKGRVQVFRYTGRAYGLAAVASEPITVDLGAFYFPGWRAEVDGRHADCRPSPEGLLRVSLPEGSHTVRVWYDKPPSARWADPISLAALAVVIAALTLSACATKGVAASRTQEL